VLFVFCSNSTQIRVCMLKLLIFSLSQEIDQLKTKGQL